MRDDILNLIKELEVTPRSSVSEFTDAERTCMVISAKLKAILQKYEDENSNLVFDKYISVYDEAISKAADAAGTAADKAAGFLGQLAKKLKK